ncbi:protein RGF1 INDUCIBLE TRANSCRIPTION FACTOR 1-like [Phragmites australis]|uniref:protein RGF1 INDUCIBLE TRANSCRIPTION FACTOR 1-like n=1 Tax=Phragmites australis TaxID=29695 RepID=UPI002D788E68|nr:protein RGF1 INDUCIBLE TRANSCRIPTION FACTOR 1-like [Phragmites australis]
MMRRVPEWLDTLLSTRFFLACPAHPASPRNECNMFCLDCRGAPPPAFCYYCRAHRHAAHRVIQIRRSSYHDVVRVSEVEDVLDITGVQTYVINSARVLFLNERPQPRGAGAAAGKAAASPYNCEICGRALLDPFRFCSLGCKLVDTKRSNGHAAATGNVGEAGGANEAEAGGSKDGAARPQGRRRKGIPHRAPFWS